MQSPVDPKGFGNERCSVSVRSLGRKGCFTQSSANICSNPNPWCRATGTCPVDRTGLLATGRRYVFHSFGLFSFLAFSTFSELTHSLVFFLPSQCPVTCGGSVRSRTVTCALTPKTACRATTKPRSRSLCALQRCPNLSLRRRPGPVPKYRRFYPPKSQPTKNPEATWAPTARATTAAPATAPVAAVAVWRKTATEGTSTNAFLSTTPTIPEIVDADVYEDESVFPSNVTSVQKVRKANDVEKEKVEREEEREEGSTPNVMMYTPGYDYVVEERTTEEETGIIDLDVVKSTLLKNPLESTTPTPQIVITPTSQTSLPTMHTTKAAAGAYPTPSTSTKTWARTTRRYPFSNPHTTARINPYSPRTHRVPLTTPVYRTVMSKAPPSTTAWKTLTTAASPQSTVTIVKLKKPAVTPKKNGPATRAKKPSSWSKGGRYNGQSQSPESPMSSSVGGQSNLMTRKTVSMDVFWVVGNWSEVGTDISPPLSYSMKNHSSGLNAEVP